MNKENSSSLNDSLLSQLTKILAHYSLSIENSAKWQLEKSNARKEKEENIVPREKIDGLRALLILKLSKLYHSRLSLNKYKSN